MSAWDTWKQNVSKQISTTGSIFRVPSNLQVSQRIAGSSSPVKPGFGLSPMPAFSVKAQAPTVPQNPPGSMSDQSLLTDWRIKTGIDNGGGGSYVPPDGGGAGNGTGDLSGYYEQPPSGEGGIDYDALIAPALQALEQAVAPAYSTYEGDVAGIEANRLKGRGELQASYATGEKQAVRRRGEVTGQSESAVDEARRQFAEISQGLQARYGGTTGTGAFTEGLAGREALRNIGQQRQALTQAITQIDDTLEQVRMTTDLGLKDVEEQAAAQKKQAKAQLDNSLNSIRLAKGELLAKKVEYAQSAMQFYQQQVGDINARNTAFKQQILRDQMAAEARLNEAKTKASGEVQKLQMVTYRGEPFSFNPYKGTMTQIQPNAYGTGQLQGVTGSEEEDDFVDKFSG